MIYVCQHLHNHDPNLNRKLVLIWLNNFVKVHHNLNTQRVLYRECLIAMIVEVKLKEYENRKSYLQMCRKFKILRRHLILFNIQFILSN